MLIAVNVPNGNVGRFLTAMLVRAGVRPRVLVRNPDHVPVELREYVEVAVADSRIASEVVAATRGVDAVYWVDPPTFSHDPLADYVRATEALVAAIGQNAISRVVFQSSVGAEKRQGTGEIDGLAATEVALDRLGVDVTHLRCGYFFTNLTLELESVRGGRIQTVSPLDAPMPWVAPRDIAEVAATTLLNRSWRGHRVQAVHGPEDLSWAQVGALLSAELGRRVEVERISDDAMRQQYLAFGMPAAMADAILGMSTGLRDGFVAEQPRSVVSTTPTTLRSWVREELLPAL